MEDIAEVDLTEVVVRSFVYMYQDRRKKSSRADIATLSTLASVCDRWRRILQKCRHRIKTFVMSDVPVFFDRLKIDDHVTGIAVLDDIFVTTESSHKVAVFEHHEHQGFDRVRDLDLRELKHPPQDIAACSELRQLFVADPTTQCVWQLERSRGQHLERSRGQGQKVKVVGKAVSDVRPVSLSMNDKRLLVVERSRLIIVVVEKKISKETTLPSNLEAVHALETVHGSFVVCHRGGEMGKSGIAEINRNGKFVRGYASADTGLPCYLSPFRNSNEDKGDFLAIDGKTHSATVFNSQLEVVRVFMDRGNHQLHHPCRVATSDFVAIARQDSSIPSGAIVDLYWPRNRYFRELTSEQQVWETV